MTSPPYEHSKPDHWTAADRKRVDGLIREGKMAGHVSGNSNAVRPEEHTHYGDTPGQIGRDSSETYWGAVKQVYGQCLLALRPAGVLCVVVKDHVRDRARVPLCDQTLRLLLFLGFEPVERIRAWLVEEKREAGLFGEVVTRKSRVSFFRRLAEKRGAPAIEFEEVLVVRKPPTPGAP